MQTSVEFPPKSTFSQFQTEHQNHQPQLLSTHHQPGTSKPKWGAPLKQTARFAPRISTDSHGSAVTRHGPARKTQLSAFEYTTMRTTSVEKRQKLLCMEVWIIYEPFLYQVRRWTLAENQTPVLILSNKDFYKPPEPNPSQTPEPFPASGPDPNLSCV